jgi:hypothetical protein
MGLSMPLYLGKYTNVAYKGYVCTFQQTLDHAVCMFAECSIGLYYVSYLLDGSNS